MFRRLSVLTAVLDLVLLAGLVAAVRRAAAEPDAFFLGGDVAVTARLTVFLMVLLVAAGALPLLTAVLAAFDLAQGRRLQALVTGLPSAAVLLVSAGWVVSADGFATREERRVDRLWADTLEPMDVVASRLAPRVASEGARRIEPAAARLDISLQPPHLGVSRRQDSFLFYRRLFAYVDEEAARADDAPAAPPPEIASWLKAHEDALAGLVEDVRQAGPIEFAADQLGAGNVVPPLQGVQQLDAALYARVLERLGAGDEAGAAAALDAMHRLGAAFHGKPSLVMQGIAGRFDEREAAGLRRLRGAPPEWASSSTHVAARPAAMSAVQGDVLITSRTLQHVFEGALRGPHSWFSRWIHLPALRLMGSDYSEAYARQAAELKSADLCAASAVAPAESRMAWWNVWGRFAALVPERALAMATEADLSAELTTHVLAARAARARDGAWPRSLTGLASSACPGRSWTYSVGADGAASFELQPPPVRPLAFHAH